MEARELIERLGLVPLPGEGGYYRESYRSRETIPASALPTRYACEKTFSTAIYYLVTPGNHSKLHRLPSDELFHFYLGDPVEMLLLHPDGLHERVVVGGDILAGQRVQQLAPAGCWQGTRLIEGGRWALLGTTVAPGFDFDDFEPGDPVALAAAYPAAADLIRRLG